jgi:hypothetical protein
VNNDHCSGREVLGGLVEVGEDDRRLLRGPASDQSTDECLRDDTCLDPASVTAEDQSDLRAVAEAAEQVRRDEALVTQRVVAARARGRSWNRIAMALGVSRQAARHRFADKLG